MSCFPRSRTWASRPSRRPPRPRRNRMETSTIVTEGLSKTYGQRTVVGGVDLRISGGEVVGLLGPNGAGKTTIFYMMVGLVPATGGRVLLNDHDITHLLMHRRAA